MTHTNDISIMTIKRKLSSTTQSNGSTTSAALPPPPKKVSPLADKPQNYYAPKSTANMTKEELSAWRKEQRRERNRQSAAESRNKTRARIEELEGEVQHWRKLAEEMKGKMSAMERQIEFLTRLQLSPPQSAAAPSVASSSASAILGASLHATQGQVTPSSSPPRSPEPSPVAVGSSSFFLNDEAAVPFLPVPPLTTSHSLSFPPVSNSSTTDTAFPALLSNPTEDSVVEKQVLAAASFLETTASSSTVHIEEESKEHIIQSRQA